MLQETLALVALLGTAPVLDPTPATSPSLAPRVERLSLLGAAMDAPPGRGGTLLAGTDTTGRPRAVEYSDLYYTRLRIHQVASYLTVPLFVAQYLAGQELWKHPDTDGWARSAHGPLAAGVAGLFAVNTVTGAWNLWEGRTDPAGRTRRWIHGLSMIVADAGFVAVGATAPDDDEGGRPGSGARTHRNLAIGSMGLALSSYLMMLLWKD